MCLRCYLSCPLCLTLHDHLKESIDNTFSRGGGGAAGKPCSTKPGLAVNMFAVGLS